MDWCVHETVSNCRSSSCSRRVRGLPSTVLHSMCRCALAVSASLVFALCWPLPVCRLRRQLLRLLGYFCCVRVSQAGVLLMWHHPV